MKIIIGGEELCKTAVGKSCYAVFARLCGEYAGRMVDGIEFPDSQGGLHIHIMNGVESPNYALRKTLEPKGSFPTDGAAKKLIFLAVRNFEKSGRKIHDRVAAQCRLVVMFSGRFGVRVSECHGGQSRYAEFRMLPQTPLGNSTLRTEG